MKICKSCGERNWEVGKKCSICEKPLEGDVWYDNRVTGDIDPLDHTEREEDFYKNRPSQQLYFD